MEFRDITPPDELRDPFRMSLPLILLPPLPFHPFLFSSLFFPSLDPLESIFVESETFVRGSSCLDQTLEDRDIDRFKDHFEVKDLNLGHPLSFDFHISFDWPCFGLLPSPFRDVGFPFDHSNYPRCSLQSHSHIFVRALTSASDFAYTSLFYLG